MRMHVSHTKRIRSHLPVAFWVPLRRLSIDSHRFVSRRGYVELYTIQ